MPEIINPTADFWIKTFELKPHPEGGYYRETYRSLESFSADALPSRYIGPRCFGTAIYFLIKSNECSKMHCLKSDEIWHFYFGSPVTLHLIYENGEYVCFKLGSSPKEQELFQVVIPSGTWFGATVDCPEAYALMGCTVAPGFDFSDFEMGERQQLLLKFPQHRALIDRLS